MSGGSWDYLTFKIEDAADRLIESKNPSRKAFGHHMKLIAHAMHEIEWVDSGDKSSPCDIDAIEEVFSNKASLKERKIEVLLDDARSLIEELKNLET